MEIEFDGIKNIIFDFGGVILDLTMQRCFDEFKKLGVERLDKMYAVVSHYDFFTQLEKGKIDSTEFYDHLRTFIPNHVSNEEIEIAWNAMLGTIPANRIQLIDKLNKGTRFRTFLLSNTNAIHYDKYVADLHRDHGFNDFSELFEKDYFSHQLGLKKPDPEIFEFILRDAELLPNETLFIDDSQVNIEGAEALGIQSFLLPPEIGIVELFPETLLAN